MLETDQALLRSTTSYTYYLDDYWPDDLYKAADSTDTRMILFETSEIIRQTFRNWFEELESQVLGSKSKPTELLDDLHYAASWAFPNWRLISKRPLGVQNAKPPQLRWASPTH